MDISKSCRLIVESVTRHTFQKRENRCKQGVCRSPKIKVQGKASLTNNLQFVQLNSKRDQRTEDPPCFSMQRDVRNGIFAGKFSLNNGKDLSNLKCLQRLLTISQLKYSILQSR